VRRCTHLPYTKYGCVRAPSTLQIILRLIVQFIFLQFLSVQRHRNSSFLISQSPNKKTEPFAAKQFCCVPDSTDPPDRDVLRSEIEGWKNTIHLWQHKTTVYALHILQTVFMLSKSELFSHPLTSLRVLKPILKNTRKTANLHSPVIFKDQYGDSIPQICRNVKTGRKSVPRFLFTIRAAVHILLLHRRSCCGIDRKGADPLKIVVMRSPRLLAGLLRLMFHIKKEQPESN